MPTELYQLSRGDAASRNTVSLTFDGIDLTWDDEQLATFVRDHAGYNIPIIGAKVFFYKGHQTGQGRIVVGTFEDASRIVKKFEGFAFGNKALRVQYENPLFAVSCIPLPSHPFRRLGEAFALALLACRAAGCNLAASWGMLGHGPAVRQKRKF